jgi:hypothetical protein
MWDRLARLDRRYIFLVIALVVVVPSIVLIPGPVPVSPATRAAFQSLENLDEGQVVLLSFSYGPSSMAEVQPQADAVLRHAFRRRLRVLLISIWPDAAPLASEGLRKVVESDEFQGPGGRSRLRDGVDYVNLGYRVGTTNLILQMGINLPQFIVRDVRGERLESLPVMQGVRNYDDIAMVFDFGAGDSPEWWIVNGRGRYGVRIAAGVTGVIVSQLYQYLDSGQLVGLVAGGVGAAEYEALLNAPAEGTRRVSVLSYVHFLILLLVVLANVLYVRERRRASEGASP